MDRINRDVYAAIVLLLLCAVLFWASFDIPDPDYGTLKPSAWPRVVIAVLALLSLVYLVQSLRSAAPAERPDHEPGFKAWLAYYRNPIICFLSFFVFLLTLPLLGMLIGGVGFVFTLMGLLGGWAPRRMLVHAAVALLTVGAMWSLFTFGLGVMLPPGVLFNPFA